MAGTRNRRIGISGLLESWLREVELYPVLGLRTTRVRMYLRSKYEDLLEGSREVGRQSAIYAGSANDEYDHLRCKEHLSRVLSCRERLIE